MKEFIHFLLLLCLSFSLTGCLSKKPIKESGTSTNKAKEVEFQQALESKNVPIKFYGQVIDQHGQLISGAKVKMAAEHVFYLIAEGIASTNIETEIATDLGGRFEWSGGTGDALTIQSIEKQGYQLSPQSSRNFGPTTGSLENPVIFKMWKLGEKASLINGNKFWGIVPDGRVYTLDLLLGTKEESSNASGDLRISVTRPAGVSRQDRYNWSFQIIPINGGIVETEDEFMYQAPASDYSPRYDFQFDTSISKWTYTVKKSFYIKTRGGQNYGRITIEVYPHYQNAGVIDLSWSVNPNGSGNLQP